MKNDLLTNRTVAQLLKIAVLPEIERRLVNGQLKQDRLPLPLHRFRFVQRRLPNNSVEPIVELNEEVRVVVETIARANLPAGHPVTIQDIDPDHMFIQPPVIDGKQQAYFLWIGTLTGHFSFFDFSPNTPGFVEGSSSNIPYPLKEFLNLKDYIDKVKPQEQLKILARNNWPPGPGYYPATLLAMHNNSSAVADPTFVKTVSDSFSPEFWDERVKFWKETNFFPARLHYIERAIRAHQEQDFITSINVILPQFEGIIMSYLDECDPNRGKLKFRQEVARLKALILSRKLLLISHQVIDLFFDFLTTGTFWDNSGNIREQGVEVNRHGVLHGAFTGFETEMISLKYLILLDGLAYMLLHDKMLRDKI